MSGSTGTASVYSILGECLSIVVSKTVHMRDTLIGMRDSVCVYKNHFICTIASPTYLLHIIVVFQLSQEVELVLNKKEVFKSAQQHWSALVPAILEYGERQRGKTHVLYDEKKKMFQGTINLYPSLTCLLLRKTSMHAGSSESDDKTAFTLLCSLLLKKNFDVNYIYEEVPVSNMCTLF